MGSQSPTITAHAVRDILHADGRSISDHVALLRAHVGLMHQSDTLTELRDGLDAAKADLRILFFRMQDMEQRIAATEHAVRVEQMIRDEEAKTAREHRHRTRRTTDFTPEEEMASAMAARGTAKDAIRKVIEREESRP